MLGRIAVLLLFFSGTIFAAPVQQLHIEAELVSEVASIQPAQPFWVALRLKMEDGWHTYYKNPGDSGLPTSVQWRLSENFYAGEIQWPKPEKIETPPIVNYGYHGEVFLLAEITPSADLKENAKINLQANVSWLVCRETCLPGEADLSLELPVKNTSPAWSIWKTKFDETRKNISSPVATSQSVVPRNSFFLSLLFAFLGGLILNLMPCVFPVLSLKVLNFVQKAGTDKHALRLHSWIFALGIIVSFLILSGLLLTLRAGGQELGWGFQLQSPQFIYFIAIVLFAISLNLLGVFEFGSALMGLGNKIKTGGMRESFLSGVLTTVVATPCTAPFMGVALAYALTQSPATSLLIFSFIGVGLAFPYVFLSHFPQLLRWLPKPGAWMESFKQAMAFPMLAAVIWLAWVLSKQGGSDVVAMLFFALWLTALAAWIYGRWGALHRGAKTRVRASFIASLIVILIVLLSGMISAQKNTDEHTSVEYGIAWQKFSPEKVEALRRESTPVFIDFTAAWCATCQVNKFAAFSSPKVREEFKKLGIVALKADWTNRDAVIARALQSYGRSGVPLYVLYGKNSSAPPVILPEVLTPQIVLDALKKVFSFPLLTPEEL
ncbi:MAG: protein-disulfide reductase DsbD family protein [Verrucomicrobiota bacterium]